MHRSQGWLNMVKLLFQNQMHSLETLTAPKPRKGPLQCAL